jgi:carbon-monoxide dehydrogenase medium subunit
MKWFDYENPKTLSEAIELISKYGDDSRLIAGGTDLIVQMRIGRRTPKVVINTKAVDEMNQLTCDNSGLTIGAAVPCYKIYQNPEIISAYPGIIDSASLIGGIQIQGRATIGGNLCNAAPSADAVPVLIANRAICNIASTKGTRNVPVEDFCTGPGQNILNPDELLVSLSFPKHDSNFGSRYIRFIPRNEMDIAVAGAGVSITLENEVIKSIHVALASVAPTPILVKKITEELTGTNLTPETLSRAGELAKEAATPITDMRGTIEYRKHLSDVLTKRALADAIKRAQGGKVNGR